MLEKQSAIVLGDNDTLRTILRRACTLTGMRFAVVSHVNATQWVACQVDDGVEFGMAPGDELDIRMTVCDEIRQTGKAVVIDDVDTNHRWNTHPIPQFYGFKSYVSLPVHLPDGSFFGTLCALDPEPRQKSIDETLATLQSMAEEAGRAFAAGLKQ